MSSDVRIAVLLVALSAGCTDGPVVVGVTANAMERVSLGPAEPEGAPDRDAEYSWDLVSKPDASTAVAPDGNATALFTPDRRGVYVIDRRLRYGVSDRITHEFVIDAAGLPPSAVAEGDMTATLGATVRLDGSKSQSPEGLELTYQWRLAERPRDSTATLGDARAATTGFVGDVTGSYSVELMVFDGDLWSEMAAKLAVTVQ